MSYIFEQFYVSTADDELNYFTDVPGYQTSSPPSPEPAGTRYLWCSRRTTISNCSRCISDQWRR